MRPMAAIPRHPTQSWREVWTIGVLLSLWIVPWLALTAATWSAGGHPGVSPVAFIDPTGVVHRLSSGSGPLQWWVLVGPTSHVVAWRFWSSLALFAVTGIVVAMAARMQLVRLGRGRLRRLLPPARRITRSARWARKVDLRKLRGRPGEGGTFLLGQHRRRMLVTQPETSPTELPQQAGGRLLQR